MDWLHISKPILTPFHDFAVNVRLKTFLKAGLALDITLNC